MTFRDRLDSILDILIPAIMVLWYTLLCGGFAYIYWFVGINDPRDIFPNTLSHIGALMVFPVGWIGILYWYFHGDD